METWIELQEELYKDSWNPEIGRYRFPFAFRGHSDVNHKLETTLIRLGGDYVRLERPMLRSFRKYANKEVVEHDSEWNWLSLAKHHSLSTRLLDWTYSPYVALHFVTDNLQEFDRDGAIIVVNIVEIHKLLPQKLQDALIKAWAELFTTEMLAASVESLEVLDEMSKTDFVIFFEPPSLDDRIINQYSLFSMISNPQTIMDDWFKEHKSIPDLWKKIIIPKELKWEIRDKLDMANITERVLFPGLDGLCTWLNRHYCPKT